MRSQSNLKKLCARANGSILAVALSIVCVMAACATKKEQTPEVPTRDINIVMADHTAELMAIPGVTGVAIGELEDHTPCILVLVVEETEEIKGRIPKAIEGHPVRILVSGVIEPMQDR